MKTYETQAEVEADIKDGVLNIEGDVVFHCDISIRANINVINGNILAGNIDALNVTALDVTALDIIVNNLEARDIKYYALCLAYGSITCASIEARREVHQKPICLDGQLTIVKKEDDATEQAIQLLKDNGYKIVKA